jgi:hypothetical protein
MGGRIILWRIDPLLCNGSINTFPRRQILGKQPLLSNAYKNMRQYRILCTRHRSCKHASPIKEKCFLCGPCRDYLRQSIGRGPATRVEAGSNTSTVTLRIVGGEEMGSLKTQRLKNGREIQGTRTRE